MDIFKDKQSEDLKDTLRLQKCDKLQQSRNKMEENCTFGNVVRFMNKQKLEFQEEQNMQLQKEQAALKEFHHDQENKLAFELSNLKQEEVRQIKFRQQLRENSHELRELERKLKAAYVNKELAAQIAQKAAEKANSKIREQRQHELLLEAQIKEADLKRAQAEENIHKKAQYKKELQEQIILGEESKRFLYEEFLREKKMIDDVVQRIHDEDEREIQEKIKKTREEMMAFKAAQDEWKDRKKREIEEENRRIMQFLQKKSADNSLRLIEKQRREEAKERQQENLAKQIYEETMRKREREDIMQELMLEEQNEQIEHRYREEMEKQIRQRLEIRQSLTAQLKEKQERLRQEAAEDAKYKEQLIEKLAEDEKLEQISEQKRRMKMLQLRRDVEQMMTERRQKRAEEMQILCKLKEQEEREMEERRRVIEQERIQLLKAHVKDLVGYLPKGLLRPEDLPHLAGDIEQKSD